MKELLQTLLFKDDKFLSARGAGWCERNHPAFYEWVMVQFPEYEEFNQKAKAIYFGDYNRCAFCAGVMPYHNDRTKIYCSKTCSKQVTAKKLSKAWDNSRLVKMKATMIERYGVDNAGKLNIEQRVANTDYKARKQATIASNLKRYGVEWATQRQETKDKIIASNLKRYGTEHRLQNKDEMQKHLNTMVSRYGSPYAMQVQNLKERCFISALGKKFDVTGCTTYEEAKQAYLQSIGITAPFPYSIGYQAKLISKDIAEKVVNGTLTRTDVANNFVDVHSAMKRYGLECGQVVNNEETEVVEYIKSLGFTVTRRNRSIIKPLELDIVVDGTNGELQR